MSIPVSPSVFLRDLCDFSAGPSTSPAGISPFPSTTPSGLHPVPTRFTSAATASPTTLSTSPSPMSSSSESQSPSIRHPLAPGSPTSSPTSPVTPPQVPQSPPSYPFYLGGVAASFAACFTHPLDMVKTRMQNAHDKQGMVSVLAKTARNEGVRGLYVGLTASLSRQMSYSLVRFGVYDALKERASQTLPPGQKQLPAWKMGLCASVAGAVGGMAGNWADVLLVRMTSDVLKPPAERFGYSNAISGVVQMAREEGVASLFRGIVPNVTRAILMNASQLATYDLFKGALLQSGYYSEGTWLHFSASFLAGTVATTVCSPADVIKARIMAADGGAAAVMDKLKQSVKNEGIGFLFRGWSPAWVRLSPNTILIFITLEKLRVFVDWQREKRGVPSRRSYDASIKAAKSQAAQVEVGK